MICLVVKLLPTSVRHSLSPANFFPFCSYKNLPPQLPQNRPIRNPLVTADSRHTSTPLESILTDKPPRNPFRFNTYEKQGVGGTPLQPPRGHPDRRGPASSRVRFVHAGPRSGGTSARFQTCLNQWYCPLSAIIREVGPTKSETPYD